MFGCAAAMTGAQAMRWNVGFVKWCDAWKTL
jgi:hypothetical protein